MCLQPQYTTLTTTKPASCFTLVLQVRMHVHSRSARLGYFPAYHLRYVHGVKYTPSRADIVPAWYDALVGGADPQPRVCAELHPSPFKSQVGYSGIVVTIG
jgi:hypothetical protein